MVQCSILNIFSEFNLGKKNGLINLIYTFASTNNALKSIFRLMD